MNRFLLFALTIGLSLSSAAHSALDLKSKALLRHQRMEIAKPDNSEYTLKVKQLKNALGVPSDYALGIIRIADGYSDDDLRQEGINVLRSRYGFAFVAIPIDQVERVADLKSVRRLQLARPLSQKLKRAREATGVDKIHQGIGLEQAYTGKGVVCGIVDTGLDPNHLNFKDDEGNSRVGFLAHLTQNPYATSADDAVIQTFYDRSTVANFTSDDRSTYHGTHTMGIMAGGYRGNLKYAEANDATGAVTVTSGANPFYGVAYDADIAAACGDLMDMIIAYGVDYILQYAENEKKPCVINLSLGSNDGAHDGHGVINQFFDACAEMANAIICVSAGNEGDMKIAVNKTFTADDNELKTFITLLNPFAPHLTEEMNEALGSSETLVFAKWPEYDEAKCVADTAEIVLQVNGKIKARMNVSVNAAQDEVKAEAMKLDAYANAIAGKTVVKEIYVKGKLLNTVVKG